MTNYHLLISGTAILGFFLFNLLSLFIGFWMGRQAGKRSTRLYPGEKEMKTKEIKPFVEDVKDDPWELAQTEETEDKAVKIVGGL
jgi:hypothetical protein